MRSAELELEEVNTDVFSLQHGDQSILLLPLSFPVKCKGTESWLEYPLCLKVCPFPSGAKSTLLPDMIFPSIREIFKGPLCRQSSGSRRGHRHSLLGSITQRSNGCPLIRLLIISAVLCCCWDSSVTPPDLSLHTLRTYSTEINLYWCGMPRKWNCGNSTHIYLGSHQCLS